jgi:predicted nucleic acid-binding protein
MALVDGFTGDRIYFDANVFIYAVEGFRPYEKLLRELFDAVSDRAIHAVTSELTLAEVLVVPFRKNRNDIVATYERMLMPRPSLEIAPVTRSILRTSAEQRASLGGRLPDAIHAATALDRSCDFFFTADKELKVPQSVRRMTLDELVAK